ncbi:hypothetical protein GCM10023350_53080 [Nocardioides endophyticus]|uniref:AbiTii domain-containing protein n=1 Tax=Nocardioides endophyticus TaxID=1353775 RepID=A0ABP8ZM05_9ACTN
MSDNLDLLAALETDIVNDSPVAPTLRRCILLGGRAGSSELRDWASQELHGHKDDASLPDYRRVPAPIYINATVGRTWRTGQLISPSVIPEWARETFANGPTFFEGIGQIEAMANAAMVDGGSQHMTHKFAMDVCAALDMGQPFQETTALYWQVSSASLTGIVEHVRTTLAELVGAIRSQTPVGQLLPKGDVASEAVRMIITSSSRSSRS